MRKSINVWDFECFGCEITDICLDDTDLILYCIIGYSRTKLIFRQLQCYPDKLNVVGAKIRSIRHNRAEDGYTGYFIEFSNGFDSITIVARDKVYIN